MTRFYDSESVLEISMYDKKTREDMSRDFFEEACSHDRYNEDLDAYKVDDVGYLVDYATSYADGTNRDFEYPADWKEEVTLAYNISNRPKEDK